MKRAVVLSVSIAFASCALLFPVISQARNTQGLQASNSANNSAAKREAMQMVPAQVSLVKALDAKKITSGQQFQATLGKAIHLKNGPELPRGTKLIGTVTTDKMQAEGTSRLALRFTRAKLKNGKVLPVKATIVGIFPPAFNSYDYYSDLSDPATNVWTSKTLQIDQIGALSGIDLHSNIASRASGVLVSQKKDDMKLKAGSRLDLAIAASKGSQSMSGGA